MPPARRGERAHCRLSGLALTVTQTPSSRQLDFGGGLVLGEQDWEAGWPKEISGPNDDRTLTYTRGAVRTETHAGGPWQGWALEWAPEETKGLIASLKISQGGKVVRTFGYGYDEHARLNGSASPEVAASYAPRTAAGRLAALTRVTPLAGLPPGA